LGRPYFDTLRAITCRQLSSVHNTNHYKINESFSWEKLRNKFFTVPFGESPAAFRAGRLSFLVFFNLPLALPQVRVFCNFFITASDV
jgi:hypothetical protein